MLGFSSFRRKPRQFSYKPIYHDPEKEELDRRRRLRRAVNDTDDTPDHKNDKYVPGSLIRDSRRERMMGGNIKNEKDSKEVRNRLIIRSVVFLILLICVWVIIMRSDMLEKIFSVFMQK